MDRFSGGKVKSIRKNGILRCLQLFIVICSWMILSESVYAADTDQLAAKLLMDTGIKGGLVVHAGSFNTDLIAALGKNKQYLVQGLYPSAEAVDSANQHIRVKGVAERVSARHWPHKHLPYADNVVNLLIVTGSFKLDQSEIMRVLTPGGMLVMNGKKAIIKPRPDTIDEWTHYLHGADGNAVAKDAEVAPPLTLQWDAGPEYSRTHEIDASVVAIVSANGRFFSIVDEGAIGMMDKRLPEDWSVVARDAFNGVLLWKKPLGRFGWPEWKPELGEIESWAKMPKAQRRILPITLPRRLVAIGDTVYTTMGYGVPVAALDAATGETLVEYKGTEGADEFIYHKGTLILVVREKSREAFAEKNSVDETGVVMCVDAVTGKTLWVTPAGPVLPSGITANNDKIFYHTGKNLICLNDRTGKQNWSVQTQSTKISRWNSNYTLLAYQDMIYLSGQKPGKLEAYSATTGKLAWTGPAARNSFSGSAPPDIYVANDTLWLPPVKSGYDPRTGEVKTEIELPPFMHTKGHHLRCYRGKATERYILDNKRGIEFVAINGDKHMKHDWVRGICRYGVMPANGLTYAPPTPCSCYPTVQLIGFNALSGTPILNEEKPETAPRFIKGPAFGKIGKAESTVGGWPMFRHDPIRSGTIGMKVAASPQKRWETVLGGELTQPIVVGSRAYIASKTQNTLYALDVKTGNQLWEYTIDAGIDSAPTYHKGMILFGSRNGWVYNLRASDGQLAWSFRAAPKEHHMVSYNKLESAWPVHGSVLVLDDVAYVAAGRTTYINNGIYLYGLDAASGKQLYTHHLKDEPQDPLTDPGGVLNGGRSMLGASLDIMATDGVNIFMQSQIFDKKLNRQGEGAKGKGHIVATSGYLSDTEWHRNCWMYADSWVEFNKKDMTPPGLGEIISFDDDLIYGVKYFTESQGQSMIFIPETKGYYLFADSTHSESSGPKKTNSKDKSKKKSKKSKGDKKAGSGGSNKLQSSRSKWGTWIPIRVRALVKTQDQLFVAGPPDIIDPADPWGAFRGRKGAILQAFSISDGSAGSEIKLEHPPVFDGMVAAQGALFVATEDGKITCYK